MATITLFETKGFDPDSECRVLKVDPINQTLHTRISLGISMSEPRSTSFESLLSRGVEYNNDIVVNDIRYRISLTDKGFDVSYTLTRRSKDTVYKEGLNFDEFIALLDELGIRNSRFH